MLGYWEDLTSFLGQALVYAVRVSKWCAIFGVLSFIEAHKCVFSLSHLSSQPASISAIKGQKLFGLFFWPMLEIWHLCFESYMVVSLFLALAFATTIYNCTSKINTSHTAFKSGFSPILGGNLILCPSWMDEKGKEVSERMHITSVTI